MITSNHFTDDNGNPDGGSTYGQGFAIAWQCGGMFDKDGKPIPPNGAFVEHVIEAAKDRLEYYQGTKFNCQENAEAITHLTAAIEVIRSRIASRRSKGILGTHKIG